LVDYIIYIITHIGIQTSALLPIVTDCSNFTRKRI